MGFLSGYLVILVSGLCMISGIHAGNHTVTHIAWFDMTMDGHYIGRFTMGLFGESLPLTVDNFIHWANHTSGEGYRGSIIHRVVPGFVVQGGDILNSDGTGGKSIYPNPNSTWWWDMYHFPDENFFNEHEGRGWVNMANAGPDTNTCQFAILMERSPHLDGLHVVFAKIIDGMDVVQRINEIPTDADERPLITVGVLDSGVYELDETFEVYPGDAEDCFDRAPVDFCLNAAMSAKCENDDDVKFWCEATCKQCYSENPETTCFDHGSYPCASMAAMGECQRNPTWMNFICPKSCGHCEEPLVECSNVHSDEWCDNKALSGMCDTNYVIARDCRVSCGTCPTGAACMNTYERNSDCYYWASIGECDNNPSWMSVYCRRACGFCPDRPTACRNNIDDDECSDMAFNQGACSDEPVWMQTYCRKTCTSCDDSNVGLTCQNQYAVMQYGAEQDCQYWANNGECRTNPGFMYTQCARACLGCTQGDSLACKNEYFSDIQCALWAWTGECESNPDWMFPNCWKACTGCV